MKIPYTGITDFINAAQVEELLTVFLEHQQGKNKRKLHVGIMMSYKTLNDLPTKWMKAFPKKETIASIFLEDPDLFNVLHYADYEGIDTFQSLMRAASYGGENIDAMQLDMVWPEPEMVRTFREHYPDIQVILQISTVALEKIDNDNTVLVDRLWQYGDALDYVLLDKSMGRGHGMDAHALIPIAQAIKERLPQLGIAAAGGLGPETIHLVQPLVRAFPDISVDAQSKLRKSGNALDPMEPTMAADYLIKMSALLP